MPGSRNLTEDVDIDLGGLFAAVWKKKFVILLLTGAAGALLYMYLSTIPARYRADAQILISRQESVYTRIPNIENQPDLNQLDERAIQSQVLIIGSDDLAIQAIKKLGLENHPEFKGSKSDPGLLSMAQSFMDAGNADRPTSEDDMDTVIDPSILDKFKRQLSVYSPENSRVVVIEFWSTDRALAMKVPNTIARLYLDFSRSEQLETERNATDWLGPEIDQLRESVRSAEQAVAEFRANSDILLGNNNALLATQQLSEVSSELSRVRAETATAEAKISNIRNALINGNSLDVIPEVINSGLIQRLRDRELQLRGEISQLSTTLLPSHPRIKALRSQLPEIERQITVATRNIIDSLENNVELARKQEQALVQDLNRLKAESARAGEAEVQLRALEREATAQRERLETYLGRYNEASSRQASGYAPSDARIIEHAVVPSSSFFPKRKAFTAAGMGGVAVLCIIAILMMELLSGRALKPIGRRTPEEMDEMVPERIRVPQAPSILPDDRDFMRDEIPGMEPPEDEHVVLPGEKPRVASDVTPPEERYSGPAEKAANDDNLFRLDFALQAVESLGKATIAIASPETDNDPLLGARMAIRLARYLAGGGNSAVLADMTGEGDTIQTILGNGDAPGLCDVISGEKTLREVLLEDPRSTLHLLPSGNVTGVPNLDNLPELILALEESYDFVVLDCGCPSMNGLAKVAGPDTVIIVPVVGGDAGKSETLFRKIRDAGYSEAIMVGEGMSELSETSAA